MTWAILTLASGVLNALWTSQIKGKVQREGALVFTASMRWGVALCLLPFALAHWKTVSAGWWFWTALSGLMECVSLWFATRGMRKDYYSTYALANTTPLFVAALSGAFLGEILTPALLLGTGFVVAGALWLYYRGHWSWWGLAAAATGACSSLASKLVIGESGFLPHSSLSFLIGAVILTVAGFFGERTGAKAVLRNISSNRWLILLSALATVSFYWALEMAPLSRVSPLVRINLLVGFGLSYFFLRETQGWKARGFGAVLLLVGLVLVLLK